MKPIILGPIFSDLFIECIWYSAGSGEIDFPCEYLVAVVQALKLVSKISVWFYSCKFSFASGLSGMPEIDIFGGQTITIKNHSKGENIENIERKDTQRGYTQEPK